MTEYIINRSNRVRSTPFTRRVEAAGVKAYTTYNHMVMPQWFRSPQEDYVHLKKAVQIWDVSVERQVEVVGPDALKLVQLTTPRNVSRMNDDQCFYIPMVDDEGGMLNDPILIRLAQNRYWVSIADSDMIYFLKGLAIGFDLDVRVFEPDVSPLAIQGPKSDDLIRNAFGEDIVSTRFFHHKTINVNGKSMIIARSGWSLQGGFEIYLDGSEHGEVLWDMLFEAGKNLDVRPGNPNEIERIEGGLLSYGNDMAIEHTPFEVGLGKYCNLDTATACVGHAALVKKKDPVRQIRPLQIDGEPIPPVLTYWDIEDHSGMRVGRFSSGTWSPDFNTNVVIGMIDRSHWHPGTALVVQTPDGPRDAVVQEKFWTR